jgi:hypothetical protein
VSGLPFTDRVRSFASNRIGFNKRNSWSAAKKQTAARRPSPSPIRCQSSRDGGATLALDHRNFKVIAINAPERVLLEVERCWGNVEEQHQCFALRACSTFNFCGSDKRLKW